MTKKQIIIFIVSLFILAGLVVIGFRKSEQVVNPEISSTPEQSINVVEEVEPVSINEKNEFYEINAYYPKVKSEAITNYFKTYVEDQVVQFKEDTSWVSEQDVSSSGAILTLDIDYKNIPSTNFQNYVFSSYSYTGGAHGLQVRKTFNFNKQGQLLTITNLFNNGSEGLPSFSRIVQNKLLKRENAQGDWIADGAGPKEENYQSFIIGDDAVTVLFDQYQVAPYSDGQIDIIVPFDSLKGYLNKDFIIE